MTKGGGRKLKVFGAQIGFYDWVVAAASQAAALRAWGVRQNLFAEGRAKTITDSAAVNAALAHPGTPLRRPLGKGGAFALGPQGLPKIPSDSGSGGGPKTNVRTNSPPKRAPDRSRLDTAEAVLKRIDTRGLDQETELQRRRAALDLEIDQFREARSQSRSVALAAVEQARKAYRRSGGRD